MTTNDTAAFHKLYGARKPRAVYYSRDFVDYVVMIALTAIVTGASYGSAHPLSVAGYALCAFALFTFVSRHGIQLQVPLIARRPQDVLFMLVYKLRNLKPMWFAAAGILLVEHFAVAATPRLPHHVESMRNVALALFYVHLLAITVYRTAILVSHLRKKELVREVLMQSAWKRVIGEKTNITLEILHAYATGLLTHVVLLAPWYLIIRHVDFSLLFLPVVAVINLAVHYKWWKAHQNRWFYRDHWLGHNSELEFVYLHGSHHDAIPSGLIAVAENGFLEGWLRYVAGWPIAFYHPIVAFLLFTYDIKTDIDMHQYIPGIFPRMPLPVLQSLQHSTHHYGSIEPYGIGMKIDRPGATEAFRKAFAFVPDGLKNSARLDEELTGFNWNNPTHQRIIGLFEKYQDGPRTNHAQPQQAVLTATESQ